MYNLLVLGPIQHVVEGKIVAESRTRRIAEIIRQLMPGLPLINGSPAFVIRIPDSAADNVIVKRIFDEIEQADIIIFDLTGNRPSVTYELGLVHAMGIPYILLTSDLNGPSFYFIQTDTIIAFETGLNYDPVSPHYTHNILESRLRGFIESGDTRLQMSNNIVTTYFAGLPLVDISAPAGIALGYFINGVKPFLRAEGYCGKDFLLEVGPKRVLGRKKYNRRVAGMVTIEPPSKLGSGYAADWSKVSDTLKAKGLHVADAELPKLPGGKRGFAGKFCVEGFADNKTVLVDLPSAAYNLKDSPRLAMLRFRTESFSGEQRIIASSYLNRSLTRLYDAFRMHLNRHVNEMTDASPNLYRHASLDTFDNAISELGLRYG